MAVALPAVPVALNVTGLPVRLPELAVTVLVPAVVPRVQLVSVATPEALVLMTAGLAGLSVPPPTVTVNVTGTPDFPLPLASVTLTEGGAATAVPTAALCVVAELARMVVAGPAVPVALNVTGLPVRLPELAVTVLLPAVVPRVQLVRVAMPEALVLMVAGLTGLLLPLPAVRVKTTATFWTGLPFVSVTFTEGGAATAVPTVALCVVTEFAAIVVAAPTVAEAVKTTGLPLNPGAVAVTVLLFVPA